MKSRVKDSISDKKDAVVGKADSLVSKVTGVVPDSGQVKHGAEKVGISKQNPIGLAIGGAAVGFIAGLILPTTRIEDEKLGEASDQVIERVKETGPGGDRARQAGRAGHARQREGHGEGERQGAGQGSRLLRQGDGARDRACR